MSEKKVRESKKDAMKRLLDQLEAGTALAALREQVEAMGAKETLDRKAEEEKANALLADESEKAGLTELIAKITKLEDDFRVKFSATYHAVEAAQVLTWTNVRGKIPEQILKGATLEGSAKNMPAHDGVVQIAGIRPLRLHVAVQTPRTHRPGFERASLGYKPDPTAEVEEAIRVAFANAWKAKENKARGFTQDEIGQISHSAGVSKTREGTARTTYKPDEIKKKFGLVPV